MIDECGKLSNKPSVIAGTDCGFGTFAGLGAVDTDIVFAKFGSLAQQAALASKQFFV